MGTITITSASFGGGAGTTPNGSRSGTLSDADFVRLIAWARARTIASVPDTRTAGQVLTDFIAAEWQAWKDGIQTFERQPPTNPTPITITG